MVGDQLIFPEFKRAVSLLSQSHTGSYTLCAVRLFEIAPVSPDKVGCRWSLSLRHQSLAFRARLYEIPWEERSGWGGAELAVNQIPSCIKKTTRFELLLSFVISLLLFFHSINVTLFPHALVKN